MFICQQFGTNLCVGNTIAACNPTYYQGRLDFSTATSGYYTTNDLKEILVYADTMKINVVPYVNIIGSLRTAKKASFLRYNRLKDTNMTSANLLNLLSSGEPVIPNSELPAGACYNDGVLNPCSQQTRTFAEEVVQYFASVYRSVGLTMKAFHAGGDGFTKFFSMFPQCDQVSNGQILRELIGDLQRIVISASNDAHLMVHEDAAIDDTTGTCIIVRTSPLEAH